MAVLSGRGTKKFKRFKTDSQQQEQLSFSLQTKKRTLDLEAANLNDKLTFLANLRTIMEQAVPGSSVSLFGAMTEELDAALKRIKQDTQ